MENVKQYYKELGKLIYAIAIADGVIQTEERDKLHQLVLKELTHYEKTYDSSGMNQAFYVDFEFEKMEKEHPKLNGTVKEFNDFVENNLQAGDEKLMKHSLQLMESIANAYSKKREKSIIEQVKSTTDLLLRTKR
jgi:hypothetical protein